MNCPVCKRELAPTLSICLTCGAMMNDTVREELQTKISTPHVRTVAAPKPKASAVAVPQPKPVAPPMPQPAVKPIATRSATSDLTVKKTSQTLVGFQSKNPVLPDWRLQLQNSVRQRKGAVGETELPKQNTDAPAEDHPANAAAAAAKPKIETVSDAAAKPQLNPRVANALRRIEESRKVHAPARAAAPARPKSPSPRAAYPFNVVNAAEPPVATGQRPAAAATAASPTIKPRLVSPLRIEKRALDTNKLPPLEVAAAVDTAPKTTPETRQVETSPPKQDVSGPLKQAAIKISAEPQPTPRRTPADAAKAAVVTVPETARDEIEEIDDLAPFSMRFGAGVFDIIISLFATAILLSPVMLSGGNWQSLAGVLAFGAAFAIVTFIYMTATVGFVGRTFGMRLFSLELIDAEENVYPTVHQAAVSASVYVISIALGGIGFLPVLFNDERRAAHDILSGTILIREA